MILDQTGVSAQMAKAKQSLQRSAERRGRTRRFVRAAITSFVVFGCGGDEEPVQGVTYETDIQPIFARRCTVCHRPGGPSGVDIRNPFSEEPPPNVGIARAQTQWKLKNPSLDIPEYVVKPGDPDDSFLMFKISSPSLELLPPDPDGPIGPEIPPAGQHMPLQVPSLSAEEIALLEDWVAAGAPNGNFMDRGDRSTPPVRGPQARSFAADIRPIFGVEDELNQVSGVCRPGQGVCARCVYCHYEGTPNPPNLSDPFGPDGVVGIPSTARPQLLRVAPGDPDRSLLIGKIRPDSVELGYGARMPFSFQPLSDEQVALVRQWIEDGARP